MNSAHKTKNPIYPRTAKSNKLLHPAAGQTQQQTLVGPRYNSLYGKQSL
jgi:hypothetical protein